MSEAVTVPNLMMTAIVSRGITCERQTHYYMQIHRQTDRYTDRHDLVYFNSILFNNTLIIPPQVLSKLLY